MPCRSCGRACGNRNRQADSQVRANITGRPLGEVAGDGGAEAEAAVVSVRTAHFDKLFRDAKHEAGLPHIHFHDSRRKACALRQLKLH